MPTSEPKADSGRALDFRLAIGAEGLIIVNPKGTIALCSLWTPPAYVERRLRDLVPEALDKEGPVAVLGGLYGGGLKIMLRNLHHNPQLDTVILYGQDFSGAGEHLRKFFRGEITHTGIIRPYLFADGTRRELETIAIQGERGVYSMDSLLLPENFARIPKIKDLGPSTGAVRAMLLSEFLSEYRPEEATGLARPEPVPLPIPEIHAFPSDPGGHSIVADSIMEAWQETLWRLARFGVERTFRNGKLRRELMNYKALVRDPLGHDPVKASGPPWNLDPGQAEDYVAELFIKDIHEGFHYTYGNRLREHFGQDSLMKVALDLSKDKDSRHAFISLWDNTSDLDASSAPCLVSLFFRKASGLLHLTATFRSHNASKAWPLNALGLLGVMRVVADWANQSPGRTEKDVLTPGTLTVISQSLTLDPNDLPDVEKILAHREAAGYRMAQDPNGYFRITVDHQAKEIVALHFAQDSEELGEYRGDNPNRIMERMHMDLCVSDIGHAMYLGSQLQRAWQALVSGKDYVQDKKKPDGAADDD